MDAIGMELRELIAADAQLRVADKFAGRLDDSPYFGNYERWTVPWRMAVAEVNLEQGEAVTGWGRLIFYVTDVDALWNHLKETGFDPEISRDASWGERYFHMPDPDGHELSFARPHTHGVYLASA
jgi:hypothetical protein